MQQKSTVAPCSVRTSNVARCTMYFTCTTVHTTVTLRNFFFFGLLLLSEKVPSLHKLYVGGAQVHSHMYMYSVGSKWSPIQDLHCTSG